MALLLDVARRGDENAKRFHEATSRLDSILYQWDHRQEFTRVLKAPRRVLLYRALEVERPPAVKQLRVAQGAMVCADAGKSAHQARAGMVSCQPMSPITPHPASRDPSGCLRQRRQTAPDSHTPVYQQKLQALKSQR